MTMNIDIYLFNLKVVILFVKGYILVGLESDVEGDWEREFLWGLGLGEYRYFLSLGHELR